MAPGSARDEILSQDGGCPMQRAIHLSFHALVAQLALGCSANHGSAGTQSSPSAPATANEAPGAIENAYSALTAGATDRVAGVIQALDALVEQQPDDGRAVFYSGAMRLWQIGDGLTQDLDEGQILEEATTAVARLERAHALLPDDDVALGFSGLAHALIGRQLADTAMVATGVNELDQDIARFPAYAQFLGALTSADARDFPAAVTHMLAVPSACQQTADSSGVFPYPAGPIDAPRRVCNNEGIVPHVYEGTFITFGDFVLRSGQTPDQARAVYRSAMNSPTFAEWPFASELQARIDQADQRAALYADDDPSNDPPLWPSSGHLCVGCHQRQP
jgi:hypothetical protein